MNAAPFHTDNDPQWPASRPLPSLARSTAQSQSSSAQNDRLQLRKDAAREEDVFFFGGRQNASVARQRRGPPAREIDAAAQQEKLRISAELARYEKTQLAEREQQRQRDREQMREAPEYFPFGNRPPPNPRMAHASDSERSDRQCSIPKQQQYQHDIDQLLQVKQEQAQREAQSKQEPEQGISAFIKPHTEPIARIMHFSDHLSDSMKIKDPNSPNMIYDHLNVPGGGAPLITSSGQIRTANVKNVQQQQKPVFLQSSLSGVETIAPAEASNVSASQMNSRRNRQSNIFDTSDPIPSRSNVNRIRDNTKDSISAEMQKTNIGYSSRTGISMSEPQLVNIPTQHGRRAILTNVNENTNSTVGLTKVEQRRQAEQAMNDERNRKRQEIEVRRKDERQMLDQGSWWFGK